jgi:Short C-terminal domain
VTRRRVAIGLIIVATLLGFLAIFALWANRQLLNTDNWTETSSNLLNNDRIRSQVADFIIDEVYANVDVQAELEQGFEQVLRPATATALAGPAASGLQTLAEQRLDILLQRPIPQRLWEEANRRAHRRLLQVLEGGGDVVGTSGGEVNLDLKSLFDQTQQSVGIGGRIADKLPDSAAQIVILRSDQLKFAQDLTQALKTIAWVLLILSFGLFALAVYLARDWRREALRAVGIGFLFAGALALIARGLAGDAVVDALATTESVRPAAQAAWDISTALLVQAAAATLLYGVVIVVGAWLAGPTRWAIAVRRNLAPYLREPHLAWGAFGVVVLALVAWGPTPAFRQVIGALLLIALLALGFELLRRQTAREFPDARREDSFRALRGWVRGIGRRARPAPTAPAAPDSRLGQLEQLGRLRDDGVLDADEFEREKTRVLAEAPAA